MRTGESRESYGRLMYVLTITVLPIIVSSAVYNCSNVVDNFLFGQGMDRLGYTGEEIAVFWGGAGGSISCSLISRWQCQTLFPPR